MLVKTLTSTRKGEFKHRPQVTKHRNKVLSHPAFKRDLYEVHRNQFPVDSGSHDSFVPEPAEVAGKVKAHLSKMSPCGM